MENDLLAINEKFDTKIKDLEERLSVLRANKQQKRERVMAYYAAIEKKKEAELIISEGKPKI